MLCSIFNKHASFYQDLCVHMMYMFQMVHNPIFFIFILSTLQDDHSMKVEENLGLKKEET